MKACSRLWVVIGFLACTGGVLAADGKAGVAPFDKKGVIVNIQDFFDAAKKSLGEGAKVPEDGASGLALVTKTNVYAFLETPANAELLKPIAPGTAVHITGKLLASGDLVQIDKVEELKEKPVVNLGKFQKEPGKQMTFSGKNMCQCGLNVGTLEHSCKLGHLHHLQTADGKIFNYLPTPQAADLFHGKGYHFKNVEVKARVFPGQFLLVESVQFKE